jgi:DNA-binding transcriptional regulator YdaS (Cro superfamily)
MWRLARTTGLSYPTVHRIARDKQRPREATARLISRATRGEVSIADLMLPAR